MICKQPNCDNKPGHKFQASGYCGIHQYKALLNQNTGDSKNLSPVDDQNLVLADCITELKEIRQHEREIQETILLLLETKAESTDSFWDPLHKEEISSVYVANIFRSYLEGNSSATFNGGVVVDGRVILEFIDEEAWKNDTFQIEFII